MLLKSVDVALDSSVDITFSKICQLLSHVELDSVESTLIMFDFFRALHVQMAYYLVTFRSQALSKCFA